MSDTDAFNLAALQRHWDRLLSLRGNTVTTGSGLSVEMLGRDRRGGRRE